MSEPGPRYTNGTYIDAELKAQKAAGLRTYFELERRRTIARLRDLDRLLGLPQTLPRRTR